MKVNIPFLYTAKVIKPRARNPKLITLLGWQECDLQELSADSDKTSLVASAKVVEHKPDNSYTEELFDYFEVGGVLTSPLKSSKLSEKPCRLRRGGKRLLTFNLSFN